MTSETKIEVHGVAEVQSLINRIPAELFDEARDAFADAVLKAQEKTSRNLQGGPLFTRTGLLASSINAAVSDRRGTLKTLKASVFSSFMVGSQEVPYAKIHEVGGTITAKNKYLKVPGGPYLNIPLPPNKTPAGVMRMTPAMVFRYGGFIIKSRKQNYIVMMPENRASRTVKSIPMFVLKKSVNIKPRLGMRKAAEDQIPTLLGRLRALQFSGGTRG